MPIRRTTNVAGHLIMPDDIRNNYLTIISQITKLNND